MKKLLAVLSVLMLVIGVVTLAAGAIVFGLPALIAAVCPWRCSSASRACAPAWCPCCTSSAPWPSAPAAAEPPLTERGMCL